MSHRAKTHKKNSAAARVRPPTASLTVRAASGRASNVSITLSLDHDRLRLVCEWLRTELGVSAKATRAVEREFSDALAQMRPGRTRR